MDGVPLTEAVIRELLGWLLSNTRLPASRILDGECLTVLFGAL